MAVLTIVRMGHPVLRQRAEPVEAPAGAAVRRLAADMIETMLAAPGIGLAANQVAVAQRVIVYRMPAERASDLPGDGPVEPRVLLNPVLTPVGAEMLTDWEGCLSIPGLRGVVPRHARIAYSGLDLDGHPVQGEAAGTLARVLQHEVDHLDGILYLDRMPDLRLLCFKEEMQHFPPGTVTARTRA